AAAVWRVAYALASLVGMAGPQDSIGEFTFNHLRGLFILMRTLTMVFYCGSLLLMFWLGARLMNKAAAWTATFILASSTIYASYSSFVRVESLSICFILAGALLLLTDTDRDGIKPALSDRSRWFDAAFTAGICAGLAAAVRLHSVTASLPLFVLLILMARESAAADYPRWVKRGAVSAAIVATIAGYLIFVAW